MARKERLDGVDCVSGSLRLVITSFIQNVQGSNDERKNL